MSDHELPLDQEAALAVWRQGVSWTVSQDANHRLVDEAFCAGWEAAAPAIAADLRTRLDHAEAALAGDNEGCRLWMLDCAKVAIDLGRRLDEAADGIDRIEERSRKAERERILASMRLPTVMDAPRDYVAGWEAAHDRIERIIDGSS